MAENLNFDLATKVKERLDIVDVISKYVILKKKGANYWGCCPFHNEKTPSFSVSPSKGIYKCFGCGEGGDVLTFLMKINNQSFSEMIREQAEALGIEIPEYKATSKDSHQIKNELFQCMDFATDYYTKNLYDGEMGEKALEYLTKRGITSEIINTYRLGVSTHAFDGLQQEIGNKFSKEIQEKAGLIIKKNNEKGYIDRFRARLMIPIIDEKGNVVAFGARALEDGQNPKYLNSPDSVIYNKSNVLYGIYQAKDAIKQEDSVLIMEGYFDVISTQAHGIKNCIASCGTSLTPGHVKMISRYSQSRKIYLAFDADNAGQKASKRGAEIIKEELAGLGEIKQYDTSYSPITSEDKYSCEIHVVVPPQGKDADEFIRENGIGAYIDSVKNAPLLIDYQLDQIFKKKTSNMTPTEKMELVKEIIPLLTEIGNSIVRDEYAKIAASRLEINEDVLSREIRSITKTATQIVKNTEKVVKKSNDETEKAQKNLLSLFLISECTDYAKSLQNILQEVEFSNKNLIFVKTTIDKLLFQVNNVMDLIQALYVTFAENNDLRDILTELISIADTFRGADYAVVIEENLAVIKENKERQKATELNTKCMNAEDDEQSAEYQKKLVEQLKLNSRIGDL